MSKTDKKVVLITGCSSGIGLLTAKTFARNGWVTYATMRNVKSDGGVELTNLAKLENLSLYIIQLDVTDQNTIDKCISYIFKHRSRIDALVNNAGFGYRGLIEKLSVEQLIDQYETNVYGAMRMIYAVLPGMKKSRYGKIINVSSIQGLVPTPYYGFYASSKFALEGLSEALSYELAKFNIQVSIVEPGSFRTNFNKNLKPQNANKVSVGLLKKLLKFTYQKDAQQVANVIFSIATSKSLKLRYVVGSDARIANLIHKLVPHEIIRFAFKILKTEKV